MIDRLNEETGFDGRVALVKPTPSGDYIQLRQQDGLYHVLIRGYKAGAVVDEHRLVRSIAQIIHPYRQWQDYLRTAEIPTVRFVFSNTTEAGIRFSPEDQFEDQPPREFPAKLTLWLYHRYNTFAGDPTKGCYLLPCELLEQNGRQLQEAVLSYCDHWQLPAAFCDWITTANHFCNTLVDRIVPGFPAEEAAEICGKLGLEDHLLVSAEPYHLFVIEDVAEIRKELPLDRVGINAVFTKDISPYRTIKVRILNGAHTSMVPVGYLFGHDTVRETLEDGLTGAFVRRAVHENIAPGLDFPAEVLQSYIRDTMDRFLNPFIRHELLAISLNSIAKFQTRILPSIHAFRERTGEWPGHLLFAWAAMICFYRGKRHQDPIPLKDDPAAIEMIAGLWRKIKQGEIDFLQMTDTLLGHPSVFGPKLTHQQGLSKALARMVEEIHQQGMQLALAQHLEIPAS